MFSFQNRIQMNQPTGKNILRLYKDLLRYGQQLKYTDQHYFINWIQREFRENKALHSPDKILFSVQVILAIYFLLMIFLLKKKL